MRYTPGILAVVALIATTGCGDKYNPDRLTHADSSGVEIVSNTGNYKPITWAFDTAFTIGGSGDSAFKRIRPHTVQVSRDGHIYILDTTTRRIDIYDASGKLTASVAPGAGGKLSVPSALVLQPDGFAVYDAERLMLVHFSADGKYIGQTPSPRQYTIGPLKSDSDAILIAQTVHDPKTNDPILSIVRVSSADTTSIIAAKVDEEMSVNFPTCGLTMMLPPIFGEPPAWTAGNGITAVAEAPLYGVRMYRGTKEFKRVRRRLKPEEANNQYAFLAAGEDRKIPMPDGTTCTITPMQVAKGSGWKPVIPAIQALAVTPDGGLWVQRVDPGQELPAVDIIDPKGEYVGTLPRNTPWPIGFLPNGNPVGLADDSLGVSRVIVYKVDKSGKAAVPAKKK